MHCVSLFLNKNTVLYFDSFRIAYIPQEVLINYSQHSLIIIFRTNKTNLKFRLKTIGETMQQVIF